MNAIIPMNSQSAPAITPRDRMSTLLVGGNDLQTVRELADVACKSGLAKVENQVQASFIILKGLELGVRPFTALAGIFIVPSTDKTGKVQLSLGLTVSLMMGLAESSGQLEDIQIPDPATITDSAVVIVKRRGRSPFTYTFTKTMAQGQYLLDKGNWKKMYQIMMLNRAISGALRHQFADVLQGLYLAEEIAPDNEVDENGIPLETPRLPTPKQPASNGMQPATSTTHDSPADAQPDDSQQPADKPPLWLEDDKNRQTVIGWCRKQLKLKDTDILRLAKVSTLDDISVQTGWGQYPNGKDAWATVQANHKAEKEASEQAANNPPAPPTPSVSNPPESLETNLEDARKQLDLSQADFDALYRTLPGGAVVANSTVNEIVNAIQMQQRCATQTWTDFDEHNLWTLADEYGLPEQPGTLALLGGGVSLRDFGTPAQVRTKLAQLAIEGKNRLTVRRITYHGQYTDLFCGDIVVRAYGRDHFRKIEGGKIDTECEKWENGKTYSVADKTLTDALVIQQHMWDVGQNGEYFSVQDGAITLAEIPF